MASLLSISLCLNFASGLASADTGTVLYGDIDLNGVVDMTDLTAYSQYLIGDKELGEDILERLDFNGDNDSNLSDMMILKQYVMMDSVPLVGTEFKKTEVSQPVELKYFACDAQIYNGITETVNAGYTGESYVNFNNETGSSITFNVDVPEESNYKLTLRYANGGTAARPLNFFVDASSQYYTVNFDVTGAWTQWSENSVVLHLTKGQHTIKTESITSDGGPNADYLTLEKTSDTAASVSGSSIIDKGNGTRQAEYLDRGLVSVKSGDGMLVSWRTLGTDIDATTFKLYRDGTLVYTSNPSEPTTYWDAQGNAGSVYTVETIADGETKQTSAMTAALADGYLDIPLKKPADMTMPDGTTCTYSASDCSTGDADGDGQYEIYVKWDPSNSQDNSKSGYTGNVYLDCYTLEGKQLFRIDLGKNIRAGAHYTQYMVYDFDGNGKCELICKTADGTVDGRGTVIGDGSKDYRSSAGYILSGNEYLTVFDGLTGAALKTINYTPARGTVSSWGDNYGNRVDRFLAGVAYLDGKKPSVVMCRGYYTRAVLVAYDWDGKDLKQRWIFDSTDGGYDKKGKPNSDYSGQGTHSVSVADVDNDGFDEIIYGSCCIDHDGKGLYSTGLGHGDALHVSDFLPERPGLEVWQCHEGAPYGCTLRDAATGQILFRYTADKDTGRCAAGNILPGNNGAEFWGSRGAGIYDGSGTVIGSSANCPVNFMIFWDSDLEREMLDGGVVTDYTSNGASVIFNPSGVASCNGTKNTPNLTADLFGDWREEIIMHTTDSSALRIFSTPYSTDTRLFTLMHDTQYRCAVAWQNTAYDQPPHQSFFMGTGYKLPAADIYVAGK